MIFNLIGWIYNFNFASGYLALNMIVCLEEGIDTQVS